MKFKVGVSASHLMAKAFKVKILKQIIFLDCLNLCNFIAGIFTRYFYLQKIGRCSNIKELQINEAIREREVRLIDAEGGQIGIIATSKALDLAHEKTLDLVKISPNAKPPVCKIMDYGKYKYEAAKRAKEAKKNQKTITVKEVRMTPNIEEHDLNVKARRAIEFLGNGDKVKVSVRFRGREMGHTDAGRKVLLEFAEITSEHGTIEKRPRMEGRNMTMHLVQKTEQ